MPLPDNWRLNTATEYLASLEAHGVSLQLVGERLVIPPGHTPSEVELVRLLKPELVALLIAARDLNEERAGILEFDAGMTREEAEASAGIGRPVEQTQLSTHQQ